MPLSFFGTVLFKKQEEEKRRKEEQQEEKSNKIVGSQLKVRVFEVWVDSRGILL